MDISGSTSGNRVERVSPLLHSKLRRPSVPGHVVARPRLEAAFDEVTSRPLTLVVAPAGSGKTQLLSMWVGTACVPTTWLSLEEMDDDPVALWTGIIAALDRIAPGCGSAAQKLMVGPARAGDVVRSLLNSLDTVMSDDAVLVLDDLHHLQDVETTGSFSLFVQHLPSWLHVVAAGRTDPLIPLDRLRVRGQVAEVRFADLRFTEDEARQVLSLLAPGLSEDEIDASIEHTDGWAAGVQLAGLAARTAQAGTGSGTPTADRKVLTADYVWHEVMATGDPVVVDLLTSVSVVDRVNGSLATAVTGRADAYELLLRAEAQGLFVHRLGSDGWFQTHPLVREALYAELARSSRHQEHHARAARWLEGVGETVRALAQWLLAEEPREALRLLAARSIELHEQGREATIGRTLDAIPPEVAATDLAASIDFAVSHMQGPLPTFMATVRDARWQAERSADDHTASLDALQAIALTMSGSWSEGDDVARRALDALGSTWWNDPAGRFAWNTVARAVALSERWDDDDLFLRDATIALRRDPRCGLSLESTRALGLTLAGHPIDSLRIGAGLKAAADAMSIQRAELDLADALARLEIGDLQRARPTLEALAGDPAEPQVFVPIAAMLALVDVANDSGDIEAAIAELGRAQALVEAVNGGPDLRGWVARTATVMALAGKDLDAARRGAAGIDDSFWGPISHAKVALATGDPTAAGVHLDLALPRSVRHRVVLGLVRARTATTSEEVLDHVTPAIELASAQGMLQTVVTEGRELMDAIERTAWRVPDEWLHRLRLAMAPASLAVQPPTLGYPEALTDRERDVLRLLPSRLTLGEIASQLYVSVNTIKFHLRVIYRKLGVNSREEASAIARSMAQSVSTTAR